MRFRIRNKILAVHAVVLVVGVLLSALIYVHGRGVMNVTETLVESDLPALKSLSDLKTDVIELEPILYEYYLSVNRGRFLERLESNQQRIEANLGVAREAFPQSRKVADIENRYTEIKSLARNLDQTLSAERIDRNEARALISAISRSCAQIIQELDGMVKTIQNRVSERAQASHDKVYGIIGLVALFSGMLFLVVVIAGHYVKAYLIGVEARKQAEDKLIYQAHHDALSGLPNRHMFQENIVAVTSRTGQDVRAAVFFLNLDRLKRVNDSLGHVVGDRVLQALVQRLRAALGACGLCEDSSLYRLEGDLFAILIPAMASAETPVTVAGEIGVRMNEPLQVDGREFFVTLSMGISVFPADGKDAITLIRNADSALNCVKQRGGNGYQCYTQEMNARALEMLELGNALRHAQERDELALHYQPQLDIETGRIVGMEALIRWRHPDRGAISPAEFIPLAEESGLILPVGEWILRTACAQTRTWLDAGLPRLRVAVNISARQFRSPDLPQTIESILHETGLDPRDLELEITESVAMQDVELAIATLRKLKQIGVGLAIDDFGTGYSSLSYLKRFPIDRLKVDQSFVCNLTTDANDAAIAEAVITLGRSLNLKVIAEGVETGGQLEVLRRYGCHEMQGYLFSGPVAAAEFARLVIEGECLNVTRHATA
ncbi:MAG: bifunctional diguanylate cyclase/phosphodiesterase [Betaproteobacteria bacterium]|nr:bifunctional diguanylate cyclase/phosphodiesterase [Betaproteobacteria bacterium]